MEGRWHVFAIDWIIHNNSKLAITMTSLLWMVCLTLVLMVVQAEAWLPSHLFTFKQRLRLRHNAKDSTTDDNDDIDIINEEEEAAERKRLSLLPWWEDSWSEAFMNSLPISPSSVLSTAPASDELAEEFPFEAPTINPQAQVLHLCFLLHGHRGFSTDLSYLQRVMQHHAELEKKKYNSTTAQQQHDMVVHCAVCNEGKTMDGVANGGERLVQEILQTIRQELQQRSTTNIQDITISIVGNSLGGIYGRYAIARLAQMAADEQSDPALTHCGNDTNNNKNNNNTICVLLDGIYKLHFNIFCTTATPHLGISKHTYVPLPRSVEIGAARALGDTGRDLFRLNDLMKTMATSPAFLDPLRKFRKRVAYANAYGTDFPVPTCTAAFLSPQSTYPHHFAENTTRPEALHKNRHIVATLHTPAANEFEGPGPEEEAIVDDLVQMSNSLDSLGWKKVFVDVRKEIPLRVALPRSMNSFGKSLLLTPQRLRRRMSSSTSSLLDEGSDTAIATSSDEAIEQPPAGSEKNGSAIHRLRQKGVVESRDVASVVSTPDDMRLSFPLGHNLMVALDRDGISGGIYKGGRPVMDSLAQELVQDIFDWNFQEESNVAKETLQMTQG